MTGEAVDLLSIVLSGPASFRGQAVSALRSNGLTVGPELHGHGLPSYSDPITAHTAGKPNSGHTPGTEHPCILHTVADGERVEVPHDCPDAGSPYEDDPGIAWISAEGHDPDAAQTAVAGLGWTLRAHGYRSPEPAADPLLEIVQGWADMKRRVTELEIEKANR
jgi:hypothetical protein